LTENFAELLSDLREGWSFRISLAASPTEAPSGREMVSADFEARSRADAK
jgi:hypothetical protein